MATKNKNLLAIAGRVKKNLVNYFSFYLLAQGLKPL
jgi:hypothetical protein